MQLSFAVEPGCPVGKRDDSNEWFLHQDNNGSLPQSACSLIMRFVAELVDFYLGVNGSGAFGTKGGRLLINCHCYDTIAEHLGVCRALYIICNRC